MTRLLSCDEIADIVDGLREAYALLRRADTAGKATVYQELGLRLTFQPSEKRLLASAKPGIGNSSCPRTDGAGLHGSRLALSALADHQLTHHRSAYPRSLPPVVPEELV